MTDNLTVQDWNKIIEEKEVDLLIEIENMIDQAFEKNDDDVLSVILNSDGEVYTKIFHPGEEIKVNDNEVVIESLLPEMCQLESELMDLHYEFFEELMYELDLIEEYKKFKQQHGNSTNFKEFPMDKFYQFLPKDKQEKVKEFIIEKFKGDFFKNYRIYPKFWR
jgi:hypothetical protein